MLEQLIEQPETQAYRQTFAPGEKIFTQGDASQDLYILISGRLDVLKGHQHLAAIRERGALFGEMSFLLNTPRTATAVAREAVEALRIPRDDIAAFMLRFPELSREITRLLAMRLDKTSDVLFGLKEFCDQLPDAVILTDRNGGVLTWNSAAERLYGRSGSQMRYGSIERLYEDPGPYHDLRKEMLARPSVQEKLLTVKHPDRGLRVISTSATLLQDAKENFQGILLLGRDVTRIEKLKRRYRRMLFWFLPALLLAGIASAAGFWGYLYYSRHAEVLDPRRSDFKEHLFKDYLLLRTMVHEAFRRKDRAATNRIFAEFDRLQGSAAWPYNGFLLLDDRKQVFCAYDLEKGCVAAELSGFNYSGIDFVGKPESIHRVLSLYHSDPQHPMGVKGVEVAFALSPDQPESGWLVFQMNMASLAKNFGVDEQDLLGYRFEAP